MAKAVLTINSKNYGSWSLRGWLLCKMAGLDFAIEMSMSSDDPATRAELLLLSPSFLVPCLEHDGIKVWDTLAIGEYLNELKPEAGLLPADRAARAHCRSICGEMHSGFSNLRSALPMNLQGALSGLQGVGRRAGRHRPHRRDLARVPGGVRRAVPVRRAADHGGRDVRAGGHALPHLHVKLDSDCAAYCQAIMALPAMQEWIAAPRPSPKRCWSSTWSFDRASAWIARRRSRRT